ncbi:MAG: hypothetical protein OWU84_13550 [Firmicutes bacterium]|nr:hypothetical protein [Bacillota bacterium]
MTPITVDEEWTVPAAWMTVLDDPDAFVKQWAGGVVTPLEDRGVYRLHLESNLGPVRQTFEGTLKIAKETPERVAAEVAFGERAGRGRVFGRLEISKVAPDRARVKAALQGEGKWAEWGQRVLRKRLDEWLREFQQSLTTSSPWLPSRDVLDCDTPEGNPPS